jgi:hypothetical protein
VNYFEILLVNKLHRRASFFEKNDSILAPEADYQLYLSGLLGKTAGILWEKYETVEK